MAGECSCILHTFCFVFLSCFIFVLFCFILFCELTINAGRHQIDKICQLSVVRCVTCTCIINSNARTRVTGRGIFLGIVFACQITNYVAGMIRWQATRWDLTKLPFSVARKFWWGVISQILHHRAQASAGNSISFDHSEPALFCLINCPALGLDGAHTSSTPQPHSPSPSLMADLDTHVNSNLPASINSPPPQADTNPQVHPLFLHISDEEVWKLKPFEVRISSPNSDGTSPTIIGFDSNIYSIVYERDSIFKFLHTFFLLNISLVYITRSPIPHHPS